MRRIKRGGWSYSQPPNVQFEINRDSPQSNGLVLWMPHGGGTPGAHSRHVDRISGLVFTEAGTPVWVADGERGLSLLFDNGSNEYLSTAKAVVDAPPFTMMAWFNSDDDTIDQTILSIADASVGNHIYSLQARGTTVGDFLLYYIRAGLGPLNVWTTTGYTVNTWHHTAVVTAAADDHAIYIDSGSKGTSALSRSPTGLDKTGIGANIDISIDYYFSGKLSDVRIYNRALTDTEIKQVYYEPWELYKPLIRRWTGWKSPVVERIPRYGFTNFQVPGIV